MLSPTAPVLSVEKALVDSLDQLRYAGGLLEVAKALYQARQRLDVERLVEYANRMRNRSLCSRLGYLLDRYFDMRPPSSQNNSRSG